MSLLPHGQHLLEQLRQQREAGFLCDCTVTIGHARFRAHRNVLAAFSEFFCTQWGVEPEAGGGVRTDDITVDLDPELVKEAAFGTLLNYMYTGELSMDSVNVMDISRAASFLRMAAVNAQCMLLQSELTARSTVTPAAEPASPGVSDDLEPPEEAAGAMKVEVSEPSPQRPRRTKRGRKAKGASRSATPRSTWKPSPDAFTDASNKASGTDGPVVDGNRTAEQKTVAARRRDNKPRGRENCGDEEQPVKEKPVCSTCGKEFSESSSLRRHMRIHKGLKPYECHLCGRSFRQGNQLKTHLRIHTGEKPFSCSICTKSFAQKCQLIFHCRMHHGEEKPYKCEECDLQFATSSNLKIHSRKHSGEKPYSCSCCSKRFAQASTLTYHMRRHTGEKPYVCDKCGKAFAVSSSLITHGRKHTGELPYLCLMCGKAFMSSGELNKHHRSHTASKRVTCEFCGHTYADVRYLNKHISKFHKDQVSSESKEVTVPLNIPIDHQTLISRTPADVSHSPADPLVAETQYLVVHNFY